MIAVGNKNGDVIVRNLLNPDGSYVNQNLDLQGPHKEGISEVILSHFQSESDACEVT